MRTLRLAMTAIACLTAAAALAAARDLDFTATYPPQARAIPALKVWLERDSAKVRTELADEAVTDRRSAVKDRRTFIPYEAARTWKVVTDLPRFLSLSLEAWSFTGGAHGNTDFDSLVWDKTANQRRTSLSFFIGKQALGSAVKPVFCRQLDAERRKKRGNDSEPYADFDKCIDPAEQTVILGSSDRRHFDRIGFLIPPYAAGPYAEGSYEVTLPVTPAVIAAVRPEWRSYFAVKTR